MHFLLRLQFNNIFLYNRNTCVVRYTEGDVSWLGRRFMGLHVTTLSQYPPLHFSFEDEFHDCRVSPLVAPPSVHSSQPTRCLLFSFFTPLSLTSLRDSFHLKSLSRACPVQILARDYLYIPHICVSKMRITFRFFYEHDASPKITSKDKNGFYVLLELEF